MQPHKLCLWPALVCVPVLLTSCKPAIKVFLYNHTDQTITLRSETAEETVTVEPNRRAITRKLLSKNFSISQAGRTYHYSLADLFDTAAYGEQRGGTIVKRVEFAPDHRVYILRAGEPAGRAFPPQSKGFPLSPR